jgi:hypothetical protein
MLITIDARRGLAVLAFLGAATLPACDSLLSVDNPARILEEQLDDATIADVLVNSALGELQRAYDDWTYNSAIMSDEAVTGHNFYEWRDIDLRLYKSNDGVLDDNFNNSHSMRFMADSVASLLKGMVPNPTRDLRVARALAVAGYGFVYLGEFYCETPINAGEERFTSDEVMTMAVQRFEEAIAVATAAKAAGTAAVNADSVTNLARVGAARAYLWLANDVKAIEMASAVPANFRWDIKFSDNSGDERSGWRAATTGANHNIGVDASFRNLGDPRVRHRPDGRTGHNQLTILYTPWVAESWVRWNPTAALTAAASGFNPDDAIRFASGLEARYIVAEASGPTAATLALVNERRAVGNQGTTTASGAALMAELRDQRRRDFFLDGHRYGDLRRWLKRGVGDFFPTGPHPNASWGNYGTLTCPPIPDPELIGNPRLRPSS